MSDFRLADFDYALPPELIAQAPPAERSDSRLLDVGSDDTLVNRAFTALPSLLRRGDLVVFNDTRVIKARFSARKTTGGLVGALIERITGDAEAWVQLRASHLPQPGTTLALADGASATVAEREGRFFRLLFTIDTPLVDWLERHGTIPLPPYITRTADAADLARYQTVYAREPGAVAAPTAGLHFTEQTLAALRAAGVDIAYVTLHVGAGTFQPVVVEDLAQHHMHSEAYVIPQATVAAIGAARARGGAVVGVGTTTLRTLEAAHDGAGNVRAGGAETTLFVTPGYRFGVVDALVTNFHLPRSTLLMLVSAFAGYARVRRAYVHAIDARYRFFSYGDAMLLRRAKA